MPDVFVSIDTTMFFPDFHYQRSRQFVFQYFDGHINEFEGWSFDKFMTDFDGDNHIFDAYMSEIPSEFQYFKPEEKKNFKLYLKALFAQQVFDVNAYFRIVNQQDMMLNKVIELNEKGYPLDP